MHTVKGVAAADILSAITERRYTNMRALAGSVPLLWSEVGSYVRILTRDLLSIN